MVLIIFWLILSNAIIAVCFVINLLLLMMILICGYERVLSNDNHLKSFIDNLLTIITQPAEHVIIAVLAPTSTSIMHNGLVEKLIRVNHYLPFRTFRLKAGIRQEIKNSQPDIVLSINETYASDNTEIILITNPVSKVNKLTKAKSIFVLSDYLRGRLMTSQPLKQFSLREGLSFKPVGWDKREYIKQQYAAGREYFYCSLFNTPLQQLTSMLKAFSLFKKWQNSSVKLLLTEAEGISKEVTKLLEHYRYRNDVVLLEKNNFNDEADIAATAFAILYMPAEDYTGLRILNYLQAEVPVITHQTGAIKEMAGDGVVYCESANIEDIANKMKVIYKDEKFRTQVITSGRNALQEKFDQPDLVEIDSSLLMNS